MAPKSNQPLRGIFKAFMNGKRQRRMPVWQPVPLYLITAQSGRFKFQAKNVVAHLNRDKIESNLSVPGIQEHQENALIKSFELSLHFMYT